MTTMTHPIVQSERYAPLKWDELILAGWHATLAVKRQNVGLHRGFDVNHRVYYRQ